MTETILKIKSVFDPKGADEARASFKKLQSALGGLNGIGTKSNGIFTNFFSSLTRIAKLRLLRGIIRSITGAFKEGTENIYQYSRALGSADASHFASTMDSLASSMLYMKNSIGAIVAPLLTSLLPAIQTVVNWFVTATQVVAQFFAALGGQVMYTKAKEYATAWKDVGSATGGAAAAAKEYKNTIMSFDELHVLNDVPESGGGGGGAGSPGMDYSNMFEEAVISSKIQKFVKWLKENFEDILDIAKTIGLILIGWKVSNYMASVLSALGLSAESALGIRNLAMGLVLTITGVTLSAKGGYDIGYEGVSLMNIIKTALGIGLAGAGGAMAASAITSLGIASIGTGVGAVFGIGIALMATLIGVHIGNYKKWREGVAAGLEDYQGEIAGIMGSENGFLAVQEQAWDSFEAKLANLNLAKNITEQLADFQKQTEYTSGEIDHIKTLIDELNGLGLEGISASWNESTQQIEINTEAIYDNIAALEEEYRKEAYKEVYIQALKDQADREIELRKARGLQQKAVEEYVQALSQYQDQADELGISLEELGQNEYFQMYVLKDETEQIKIANEAIDEATRKYDEATEAVNETSEALGFVQSQTYDGSNQKKGFENLNTWANELYWKLYFVNAELATLVKTVADGTVAGWNIAINAVNAVPKATGGFVQAFASGGLKNINSADIFLANENGNAEMIGRIGNRTAVGTQQQMTDSIAEGIYRAMMDAMSGNSANTEVNVYMNDEVVARAADRGQRSLNRRFNVSLA